MQKSNSQKFYSSISSLTLVISWFMMYCSFVALSAGYVNDVLDFPLTFLPFSLGIVGMIFARKSKYPVALFILNFLLLIMSYVNISIALSIFD